jgi:Protein of unknown function (DUF3025)
MQLLARRIAWTQPWLAPYRAWAALLDESDDQPGAVAARLNVALARQAPVVLDAGPLRFVAQQALPAGEGYESFIARTATVPTRDNLHDYFSGLVWLRFPALKRRLNALQAEAIVRDGVDTTRGALRDRLTLFDENAALWQAPAVLVATLRRRDWPALFVTHRTAWHGAQPLLFGHALLDKLTQPRKAITAHVWPLPEAADPDAAEPSWLTPQWLLATRPLPLPVLGVPGWWPGNRSAGFYDDTSVFSVARG